MSTSIWRELAISPSTDEREIRRAYARRLKIVHPEDDPAGFQTLRAAFEQAMNHARHAAWSAQDWPEDDAIEEGLDAAPAQIAADHTASVSTLDQTPQQDPALVAEIERDRAERAEHQRRCDALTEALRHPTPDDEAVLTALVAVFRSSALGALDVHDSTEHWLGQLAGQRGPGFGVMLEPTITFFGWDHQPVGHHWNPGLGALQHRADLETIHRLRNPASAGHEAFMILSRPIGAEEGIRARFQPELGRRIAALLARIDQEVPYVLGYLNADAVAWWREYLSRPRFGARSLWFTLAATGLCGLFAMSQAPSGAEAAGFLAGLGVGLATSSLLTLAAHYLFVLPRWKLKHRSAELPIWLHYGWAPAILAVTLLAASAPNTGLRWAIAALAVAIAGWSFFVRPSRDMGQIRIELVHALFSHFIVVLFWGLVCTGLPSTALVPVGGVALITVAMGRLHLLQLWKDQSPNRQRGAAALIAVAAAAVFVLFAVMDSIPSLALGVAASLVLGLAVVAVAADLPAWLRRSVFFGQGLGIFIALGSTEAGPLWESPDYFVIASRWFLGGVIILALGTMVPAIRLPKRNRRKSADHFA